MKKFQAPHDDFSRLMRELDNDPLVLSEGFRWPLRADFTSEADWMFVPGSGPECDFCSLHVTPAVCAKHACAFGVWTWTDGYRTATACAWCKDVAVSGKADAPRVRASYQGASFE